MTWDPHAMARVVDAAQRQQQQSAGPDSMMEENSGGEGSFGVEVAFQEDASGDEC